MHTCATNNQLPKQEIQINPCKKTPNNWKNLNELKDLYQAYPPNREQPIEKIVKGLQDKHAQ